MNYVNKIELAGNVCSEVQLERKGRNLRASFRLRTEYAYRKDGSPVIEKMYHNCVIYSGNGIPEDALKKIHKETAVHLTGRLRYINSGDKPAICVLANKFNFVRSKRIDTEMDI